MAFEYTPYRNPYIGTIADLMARGEEAKAKALIDVASAQARAAEAKGQIYGNAISSIGNQIGNIPAQMQANKEQAFKAGQQARMVRGQQQEDAAEAQYNQMVGSKNRLGGMFGPMSAPVVTPATTTAGTDMESENIPDTPETQTLPSRAFMPTVTNPYKRLAANDVKGLDLWDIEAASQQFASMGLGVQGQKYLELMRGSNSDMEKHHSSALAVAKNDAARILRFTDSQIPSAVDQLVEKYTNNGVFPMQQLEMIKQQIAGIKQLPPQQQLLAYKKLVQAVGDVEPKIVTNTPGSVSTDITIDEIVGSGGPVAVSLPQSTAKRVRVTLPNGKTEIITADYVPGRGMSGTYLVNGKDITSLNPQLIDDPSVGVPSYSPFQGATGVYPFNNRTGQLGGRISDLKPGEGAAKDIADARTTITLIKNIADKFTPDKIGPIVGRYKTMQAGITGGDSDYAELAAQVNTLRNTTVNLLTGKQMSGPEAERIFAQLPGLDLPFDTFLARLKTSQSYFEEFAKNREDVAYGRRPGETGVTPPPSTKTPTGTYDPKTGRIVPIGGA